MLECRETLDAELDAGGEEWILDINPPRHGFFLSSLYTGIIFWKSYVVATAVFD